MKKKYKDQHDSILEGRLIEKIIGSLKQQPKTGPRGAVWLDYPALKNAKIIPSREIEKSANLFKNAFEQVDTPLFDADKKGGDIPKVYSDKFRNQLNSKLGRLELASSLQTMRNFEGHAMKGVPKGLRFNTGLSGANEIGFDYSKTGADKSPTIQVDDLKRLESYAKAGENKFVNRVIKDPGSILGHELEHALSDEGEKPYFINPKSNRKRLAYKETPAVFAEIAHQLNNVRPRSYPALQGITIRPSLLSGESGKKGGGVTADFYRRESQKHFINKGVSMSELLSTKEGRQFLNQQMGRSKENQQAMDLTKGKNSDPDALERLLRFASLLNPNR